VEGNGGTARTLEKGIHPSNTITNIVRNNLQILKIDLFYVPGVNLAILPAGRGFSPSPARLLQNSLPKMGLTSQRLLSR
jgi:hypothetical protein